MRRQEREVIDLAEIERILDEAQVCRLSLFDGDYPYILPLSFGYTLGGGLLTLYFHSAPSGKKLDLIRKNNHAAFEIDKLNQIVEGDIACAFTAKYESITGIGSIEIINGIEKLTGLNTIMSKYDKNHTEYKYSEQQLNNVVLLKLTVESFCCKANK